MQTRVIKELSQEEKAIKDRIVKHVIKHYPALAGVDPEVAIGEPSVVKKRGKTSTEKYDFVFRKPITSKEGVTVPKFVHVVTEKNGDVIDIFESK